MTEAEWLEALPDLGMLIGHLANLEPRPSGRKIRLCMAAFCRAIWHVMTDGRCRHAVEVAERFADDPGAEAELKAATKALPNKRRDYSALHKTAPHDAARSCTSRNKRFLLAAMNQVHALAVLALEDGSHDPQTAPAQLRRQAQVIRDVFGNPFRPVAFNTAWQTAEVLALAEAAYAERILPSGELDPQRLAVLADALEEAGAGGELLAHLRGPGLHVRGCFAVDLLTGRFADPPRSA
jgi:hypothetical protein